MDLLVETAIERARAVRWVQCKGGRTLTANFLVCTVSPAHARGPCLTRLEKCLNLVCNAFTFEVASRIRLAPLAKY